MVNSRIFLIGMMGAGKTSIGKKLAQALALDFMDADHILQQQQAQSIAQIIQTSGEQYFRWREEQLLASLTAMPNIVLATGGGSVLSKQSREHLRTRGLVCYLQVSPRQQVQRLEFASIRPLLPVHAYREQFFQQMLAKRSYLYTEIADIILDTDGFDIDTLTHMLAKSIRNYAYTR